MFFGATAQITGNRQIEIKAEENSRVDAVVEKFLDIYPALAHHKLLVAINEEYADADTLLSDGDEVAVFTAVSGG